MMTTPAIETAFPLTPLQEGMLYHTIRSPAEGLFHGQFSAILSGSLLRAQFARAWELAATRHAVMRTFISWERRERPLQVVRPAVSIPIEYLDWEALDETEEKNRWQALLLADRKRGFELSSAPLTRLTLVRRAPDQHRLLWSMHHALLDGWSSLVVFDEVLRAYTALVRGAEPEQHPAPRFDQFVAWLDSQDAQRDEAFWRTTLADAVEQPPLPGGLRSWRGSAERSSSRVALTSDQTQQLTAVAQRLRVTINTLLMGAWTILLGRHGGSADVRFGVTVSERPAEIEGVNGAAGLYLATVPVCAPKYHGVVAGEWLRKLQRALSDARTHGAPGLAAIHRWSALAPGAPLFESLLVFENFHEEEMRTVSSATRAEKIDAGELVPSSVVRHVPNDVPLVLFAVPGEQLRLEVVYDPAAVPSHVAKGLPSQVATWLTDLSRDPNRPVSELSLMSAEERALLVDDWGVAPHALPSVRDVIERFEAHAAATPDAVALETEVTRVTYRALDRYANRLASRLTDAGIGEGALVGLLADRSVEAVAAILGVLKLGAAYVPLDPSAPSGRIQRIAVSLDAVLAPPSLATHLPDGIRSIVLDEATSLPDSPPGRPAHMHRPAYVVFTSGSTGEPKGVVVERGQLAGSTAARDAYYPEPPRSFLLLSSLTVDSAVAGIFWTLVTGGTLVLPGPRAEQDLDSLVELAERGGVTHTLLVPALYRLLLDHGELRRLTALRCVIVAGEACPPEVVRRHHMQLAGVPLHNEYGPSEGTVWATAGELGPAVGIGDAPVSIGRPVPGARVYLLDEELRLVPTGAAGELCIGGAFVAREYLGMPDETAHRFLADPFNDGGRLYRTGDRARFLADGTLEFLGRGDRQIKVRGFRVEPEEIERVLAEYPGINEVAVELVRPAPPSDADSVVATLAALSPEDAEQFLQAVETPV